MATRQILISFFMIMLTVMEADMRLLMAVGLNCTMNITRNKNMEIFLLFMILLVLIGIKGDM